MDEISGLEPEIAESKSAVLPLHYISILVAAGWNWTNNVRVMSPDCDLRSLHIWWRIWVTISFFRVANAESDPSGFPIGCNSRIRTYSIISDDRLTAGCLTIRRILQYKIIKNQDKDEKELWVSPQDLNLIISLEVKCFTIKRDVIFFYSS